MSTAQYDWIPFYEELADKLLEYKDNRGALIERIQQIYDISGIKYPTLERNEAGENKLVDIDPFTIYGLFNKSRMKVENRFSILKAVKHLFSIEAAVPSSFDGIPVLNPLSATFYYFLSSKKADGIRSENDIPNLWELFSNAITLSHTASKENEERFISSLDKVIRQKGSKWKFSMGLFWIRPNRFINLDSRNRWFLKNNGSIPESISNSLIKFETDFRAEDYLLICNDTIAYIESNDTFSSIPDLSYNAWSVSKQDDDYEKITEGNSSTSKAKFLRWFRPLLQALRDLGGRATPKEARDKIIQNERLTTDDIQSTVGKTNTPEFNNDVAWARQYLVRGGYIDNSERGIWKLTEAGWAVDMTDELASELFRRIVKENQSDSTEKGTALADEDANTKRYWIYSPGYNASKWNECTDQGIMLIGWSEIGDLTRFSSKAEMKAAMQEAYGDKRPYRHASLATWQFANELKPGDIVFAKKGRDTVIGRGVVESGYVFDDSIEDEYKNIRKVKWTDVGEWEHPGPAVTKTLTDITPYTEYVEKLNAMFDTEDDDDDIEVDETPLNTYTKADFLEDVYISEDSYETLVGLLRKKKNVILTGAPGVGKTFAAKRLAYSMMGVIDSERVHLVQFHQSYTYEDFVEGFRPSQTGLNFEIKKGAFYTFCKTAADDKENDYFFIIDEINRGNLSKIFGELFILLEEDKREKYIIQLLYSSDKFSVPKNVYIIGMMNTADRSLAMIDYALRRRFAFYEMKPSFESEGFKEYQYSLESDKLNRLIDCIVSLNQRIADDDSLGDGFCIGHSYFCKLESIADNTLSDIVEYEIIPLLKEYWFDEPSKVKEWSGRLRSAIK